MNIHSHPNYSFFRALIIYIVAVLFLFFEMGVQVSPSVMAFELMDSFRLDAAGLGVIAGVYFYSYSLMQLPAGLMFDRLGARTIIPLAILGCAIGAYFFGNTETAFWAAVGRFLMGLGSAFAFTGVLVVAALWFRPHRFALLVGLAQLFAALGAMGGAYPVAVLLELTDWRTIIVGLSIIGAILAVLAWLIIRDHPKKKVASDVFHSPRIKDSLRSVFSNPQSWWIGLYAFASWAPMALFAALWGAPFLKVRFAVSNQLAASSLSFVWLGLAVTSPIIGWLSDKIGKRGILMFICSIVGILSSLIVIYIPNLSFWTSYIWMFLMGSASAGQILSFAVIKDINSPTGIATAIGFNNMAVVLGGAVFQPLVGLILKWNWDGSLLGNTPFYTNYDYAIALVIIPLCYLVCCAVSALCIRETNCKPSY
ncbi:MAG: hypothetical protein S4CHLAM6_16060 [Chlamydiae bacterium]|nr:hypothetical protein [Chlamydiota bacterium]